MKADYSDKYLQFVASVLHSKKCRYSHMDQCGWDYDSWEDTGKSFNAKHRYMDNLVAKMEHAENCGMDLEQFIKYEKLDEYDNSDPRIPKEQP